MNYSAQPELAVTLAMVSFAQYPIRSGPGTRRRRSLRNSLPTNVHCLSVSIILRERQANLIKFPVECTTN